MVQAKSWFPNSDIEAPQASVAAAGDGVFRR